MTDRERDDVAWAKALRGIADELAIEAWNAAADRVEARAAAPHDESEHSHQVGV